MDRRTAGSRGFTLVELLVVIAIIGMLTSVTLAAVTTARTKAANAAIVDQLNQFRVSAELVATETTDYDSICTDGTVSAQQFRSGATNAGRIGTATVGLCLSSGTGALRLDTGIVISDSKSETPGQWGVSILLKDNSGYYCVDSAGVARVQATRGLDLSPLDMECD